MVRGEGGGFSVSFIEEEAGRSPLGQGAGEWSGKPQPADLGCQLCGDQCLMPPAA